MMASSHVHESSFCTAAQGAISIWQMPCRLQRVLLGLLFRLDANLPICAVCVFFDHNWDPLVILEVCVMQGGCHSEGRGQQAHLHQACRG